MGKKVLLADDSITIQKLVEMAFSDTNLELVAVSDGKQAVERIGDVKPDIILADAIMPLLDGYQVCEWVKSQPEYAHIPVVLLTGRFQPFDQARAEAVKIDERVVKPFVQEQLVELIYRLVSGTPVEEIEAPAIAEEEPIEKPEEPTPAEPLAEQEEVVLEEEEETLFLQEETDEGDTIVEEATRADMEKMDFDNETIRVNPDELKAYLNDMRVPGVPTQVPETAPEVEGLDENEFDDSFNRSIESLELDEFEELQDTKIPSDEDQNEIMSLEEAELLEDEHEESDPELAQEEPEVEEIEEVEEVEELEEAEEEIEEVQELEEEVSAEVATEEDDETLDEVEEVPAPSIDEIDTVSVEEEEAKAIKPDPDEDLTAPFPQIDVDTNVVFERQGVPDEPEKAELGGLDQLEFEEESFTEEPITEPSDEETAPDIEKPSELDVALHADISTDDSGELEEPELITEPTEPEPMALEDTEISAEEEEFIEELDDADLISEDEELTQEQEVPVIEEMEADLVEKGQDLAMSEDLLLGESLASEDQVEDLDLSDPALIDVEDSEPFELGEAELIEEPPFEPDIPDVVFEAPISPESFEPKVVEPAPLQGEPILSSELDSETPTEDLSEVEFLEEFDGQPPEPVEVVEEPIMEEIEFDLQLEAEAEEKTPPEDEELAEVAEIPVEPVAESEIDAVDEVPFAEENIIVEEELESEEIIEEISEIDEESVELEEVELEEETQPVLEVQPSESTESVPISTEPTSDGHVVLEPAQLDYLVEQVVEKVMARLGDTVGNIAWEVIPELSEAMIKKRIFELEQSPDSE